MIPLIHKYGGEVVVADSASRILEGKGHQVNTVIKFPSEDEALNFYRDPDYLPLKVQTRFSLGAVGVGPEAELRLLIRHQPVWGV